MESLQTFNDFLFEFKDQYQLLLSEMTVNGFYDRYFRDQEVRKILFDQMAIMKRKVNIKTVKVQFSDAELLAILLYTHTDQELYRNLRRSHTDRLFLNGE